VMVRTASSACYDHSVPGRSTTYANLSFSLSLSTPSPFSFSRCVCVHARACVCIESLHVVRVRSQVVGGFMSPAHDMVLAQRRMERFRLLEPHRLHIQSSTVCGVYSNTCRRLLPYAKLSTFYLIVTDTEFAVTYFAYGGIKGTMPSRASV
jgi:hypothetical protein